MAEVRLYSATYVTCSLISSRNSSSSDAARESECCIAFSDWTVGSSTLSATSQPLACHLLELCFAVERSLIDPRTDSLVVLPATCIPQEGYKGHFQSLYELLLWPSCFPPHSRPTSW